MGLYDIEMSIRQPDGSRIARRLAMIQSPSAIEVMTQFVVRVFSHEADAYVYEGIPGVLWIEARRQSQIANRLVNMLATLVGQDKAQRYYEHVLQEESLVKLD